MPSSSKKQHDFMNAVAHSPAFAKKVGVPQSVGKDFSNADKSRKFKEGGDTMATKMNPAFKAMIEKNKAGAKPAAKGKPFAKGGMTGMGAVKTAAPSRDGIASKGKTKGTMVKMAMGGKACK
jgi:hypothetical protein